jgi:hypothetical protein
MLPVVFVVVRGVEDQDRAQSRIAISTGPPSLYRLIEVRVSHCRINRVAVGKRIVQGFYEFGLNDYSSAGMLAAASARLRPYGRVHFFRDRRRRCRGDAPQSGVGSLSLGRRRRVREKKHPYKQQTSH